MIAFFSNLDQIKKESWKLARYYRIEKEKKEYGIFVSDERAWFELNR